MKSSGSESEPSATEQPAARKELKLTGSEQKDLLGAIRTLIAEARRQAAVTVNVALTLLYWRIGQRIYTEVLGSERAAYGDQIVATLSRQLVSEYGRGYTEKSPAYDSVRRDLSG